jgi:hypothetical protein
MDANTYYANQYLSEQEQLQASEEKALKIVNDPKSGFYIWDPENFFEGLGEISPQTMKKIAEAHTEPDRFVSLLAAEVEKYWLNVIVDSLED